MAPCHLEILDHNHTSSPHSESNVPMATRFQSDYCEQVECNDCCVHSAQQLLIKSLTDNCNINLSASELKKLSL